MRFDFFFKKTVFVALILFSASLFASPKYVFLFIGDGMNVAHRMLANEYQIARGEEPLAMNTLPYAGFARTKSASARITDSAAAATAIATGTKTRNGTLGLDSNGKRLESSAEVAKRTGKKVGIITTVTITHATPAGFYAHTKRRSNRDEIIKALVDSKFDYFAGGGLGAPNEEKSYGFVASNGYHIVRSLDEFKTLKNDGRKYLTYFANHSLPYAIDDKEGSSMPSVALLVKKAIDVLDNEKGFFIMCEGGKIDHAAHCNDSGTVMHDVLALDEAVKEALRFYEKHKDETLIIVTGDHETGGLSMGITSQDGFTPRVELLEFQKNSIPVFNKAVLALVGEKKGNVSFSDVEPILTEYFGFLFKADPGKSKTMVLSDKEIRLLKETFDKDVEKCKAKVKETDDYLKVLTYELGNVAARMLDKRIGVKWTTIGHSALPVYTTSQGVKGELFTGFFENTHFGNTLKQLFLEQD
jgi:alkaline phosphatase